MSLAGIVMDLVLMALLIAALAFGVRLDKRLKALKSGQEDFARAVADLDQAAIKAHESLNSLHDGADESQELLHGRILVARDLIQKLDQRLARAERMQIEIERSGASPGPVAERSQPKVAISEPVRPPSTPVQPVPPRPTVAQSPGEADRLELLRQAIRANRLDIADSADFERRPERQAERQPEPARQPDRQPDRAMQRPAMRTRRMLLEREAQKGEASAEPMVDNRAVDERLKLTETALAELNEVLGALSAEDRAQDRAQPAPRRPASMPTTRQSRLGDDLFDADERPVTRRTPPGDF